MANIFSGDRFHREEHSVREELKTLKMKKKMNEKMYCPMCHEKDGNHVKGEKLSMKEKIKEYIARKILESKILIDPAPIATSPSLVSVLFKTMYKCPVCGGRWIS